MSDTPVTRENTEHLPDATLQEGVSGLPEIPAHVAILSKRKSVKPKPSVITERAKP